MRSSYHSVSFIVHSMRSEILILLAFPAFKSDFQKEGYADIPVMQLLLKYFCDFDNFGPSVAVKIDGICSMKTLYTHSCRH